MSKAKDIWVGFDLGGTKMLASSFNSQWEQLSREKRKTRAAEGTEAVKERIIETLEKVIRKSGKRVENIKGIGIGVPGTIDVKNGTVLEAPNLGWENVKLKQFVQDAFGCPVTLCNDVDAGLYGEYTHGAAQGSFSAVGVFPGTGVGGACVIDGQLLQGKRRTAMEIGHIGLYSGGPLDGAYQEGTLETVSSRLAISAAAVQAVYRGAAPNLRNLAGTDFSQFGSSTLRLAIDQGDHAIERIVRHAALNVGKAVVTLVHLFSPDMIVLGGGLVEAMPSIFIEETRDFANHNVLKAYKDTYEVVQASLGGESAVLGAAAWARKMIAS